MEVPASFFCRHIENKKAGRTSMMISTKEQLKNCLSIEKEFYVPTFSLGRNIRNILLGGPDVERWKYIKALRLTDNSCLRPERWIVLPYLTVTVFSAGLRVMVYSPGATRMLSPFSVPNQYSFATLPPQP